MKIELRVIKAKLLRFIGITKLIQLSISEKKWIKLCKGHFKEKYPYKGNWVETMKPLFIEIYGWNPDEDNNYSDYLVCIFNKLLNIHLKIQDDKSGSDVQLKNIFDAAFNKSINIDQEIPIKRSIVALCGLIQCNTVRENNVFRYHLNL